MTPELQCRHVLASLLPPGWQRMSTDSVADALAPRVTEALRQAGLAGHYTQDHHEALYAGLRALRGSR